MNKPIRLGMRGPRPCKEFPVKGKTLVELGIPCWHLVAPDGEVIFEFTTDDAVDHEDWRSDGIHLRNGEWTIDVVKMLDPGGKKYRLMHDDRTFELIDFPTIEEAMIARRLYDAVEHVMMMEFAAHPKNYHEVK